MIDLRNHKNWDQINGTLSVSMNPHNANEDSSLYVLLNGNTGNFSLDYTEEPYNPFEAKQRAWSSDTGYYVKILNEDVKIIRWWDDYEETLPLKKIQENPKKFYSAITKHSPKTSDGIISFAKEAFIRLRNCISQADNGQSSLRAFMYLLAALEDNVALPEMVDQKKWHLEHYNSDWIPKHEWEWLYKSFEKGSNKISPLIKLVLRHASNRLFQEAHREATRQDFQVSLWGGANRMYNSGISEGAYYTPTALVRTIVQESIWALESAKPLIERSTIKILDPACGSAEFLREALRQLKIRGYTGTISVYGWDISSIACEMSAFVLNYESNTEWQGKVNVVIENKDSLLSNWNQYGEFDMILMNPPFRSFDNLGDRKVLILDQLAGLVNRQPDMTAAFWKKAADATASDGALGIVMPHSLLGAETYKKLRAYIKETVGMDFSLVARLGSAGLFEKAMIIPAVIIGVKTKRASAHTVLWTDYQQSSVYTALRELRIYRSNAFSVPVVEEEFSIYDNKLLTSTETWTASSYLIHQLSEKLKDFTKVGDLFKVTRGADTGNNAAFLLDKDELTALPPNEQKYFRPCIMRDSIVNGQLNESLFVFYPYGNFSIANEVELKKKLPKFYQLKLIKHEEKLKARKGLEIKWWELSRSRSFHDQPKLVSSYFGKSGYFAYDREGKYIVGQSFAWLPIREELKQEKYSFAYLALLHSDLIDRLLGMVCHVLDGGYYDLSKHYIEKMPMPDLENADAETLLFLHETGLSIHNGGKINQGALNQIVSNVYGLIWEDYKNDYAP